MRLYNKNILLISPERWDHIFVSKHHYAVCLAKRGNKVFFLNPPSKAFGIESSGIDNLFIVQYRGFVPGLRFFPSMLRRWFLRAAFLKLQRLTGASFDVIWSFDNSVFFDFSVLDEKMITISHIVDPSQDFNTELAAKTASVCLCNTELLEKRLSRSNQNTFRIKHGYHQVSVFPEVNLPGTNQVKALYVGNLNIPYIDWAILYRLVAENPTVDFIFIGPGFNGSSGGTDVEGSHKELVASQSNVYSVGKVSFDKVQAYERAGDIMLLCYQEAYQQDQVANSHKIMEYLGCGKAIVSTFTKEYEGNRELIVMSTRNEELPGVFKAVVNNLPHYNSDALVRKRIELAMDNTYEKQVERIEKLIYAARKN